MAGMRLVRCLVYAGLVGLGLLAFFLSALFTRGTGRDDAGGSLPTIGLILLAAGAVGALYEWAFWQRARRLRARAARADRPATQRAYEEMR